MQAELTPVFDIQNLRGQVLIVDRAWALLQKAAGYADINPKGLRQAVETMHAALKPILARGPTTLENASVTGYKPYPGIEVVSLPGDDGDFISFHLLRIDGSLTRLRTLVASDQVLSETASQIAGEFIPPLRAIEHQIKI